MTTAHFNIYMWLGLSGSLKCYRYTWCQLTYLPGTIIHKLSFLGSGLSVLLLGLGGGGLPSYIHSCYPDVS